MLDTAPLLVDAERALVSRKIFFDEDIYALELERIFRRCWLYVGHDSMIPEPGDFLANYMGEDPVILWRGDDGHPRVLLNTCPHRGNKLCLYDRGNAKSLTCSYHGWTFNDAGALIGVPFDQASYEGRLDRAQNGLHAAKVATYGGLIFAAWEPAESLEEHLASCAGGSMRSCAMTISAAYVICPAPRSTVCRATGSSPPTTSSATTITCR